MSSTDAPQFVPGNILVGFEGDVAQGYYRDGQAALSGASHLVEPFGLHTPKVLYKLGATADRNARLGTLWKVPSQADIFAVIDGLNKLPGIAYAEPDYIHSVDVTPNDPRFGELYGLNNTGQTGGTPDADIDAPEAWDTTTGSSDVVVGVIDTGIDWAHEDLNANVFINPGEIPGDGIDNDGNGFIDDVRGWDCVNNDNNPFDDNDHGTHVSGTIGAVGNNGIGVTGVNWNVRLMGLKFLNAAGFGSTSDAIVCLDYATMMKVDHGVNLVATNNSWGGGGFSQALQDSIQQSADADVLFIAAAGNANSNNDATPHYPSNYEVDNIIAVAATDHNDNRASFSSFGATTVDLGAPGVGILSTTPGNTYSSFDGTSMATPHVSGVAALAAAALAESASTTTGTSQSIKTAILQGVDQIPSMSGITVTGGRLNAQRTLAVIQTEAPFVISPSDQGETFGSFDSLEFTFNEAMNTSSFAIADDVASFTGPGGVDLTGQITGFSWIDGDTTLRLTINSQSAPGDYAMTIGPSILAADNGNPMDQDLDGTAGEIPQDQFTATFKVLQVFAYSAVAVPILPINLEAGQPGVGVLLNNADDGTAAAPLGSNTFNFYGETYTGSNSLWVSSNGLITFGSGNSAYQNADLTSSPGQAAISPLWDDWRTDRDPTDHVLGRALDINRDGTPDVAIIEWSQVQHWETSPSTVTFQVLLELNTGDVPGRIMFNYPDLDSGNSFSEGASASVGIKDAGTQGPNRLLISFNSANPLVGSGKAIQIATPAAAASSLGGGAVAALNSGAGGVTGQLTNTLFVNPPAAEPGGQPSLIVNGETAAAHASHTAFHTAQRRSEPSARSDPAVWSSLDVTNTTDELEDALDRIAKEFVRNGLDP